MESQFETSEEMVVKSYFEYHHSSIQKTEFMLLEEESVTYISRALPWQGH